MKENTPENFEYRLSWLSWHDIIMAHVLQELYPLAIVALQQHLVRLRLRMLGRKDPTLSLLELPHVAPAEAVVVGIPHLPCPHGAPSGIAVGTWPCQPAGRAIIFPGAVVVRGAALLRWFFTAVDGSKALTGLFDVQRISPSHSEDEGSEGQSKHQNPHRRFYA